MAGERGRDVKAVVAAVVAHVALLVLGPHRPLSDLGLAPAQPERPAATIDIETEPGGPPALEAKSPASTPPDAKETPPSAAHAKIAPVPKEEAPSAEQGPPPAANAPAGPAAEGPTAARPPATGGPGKPAGGEGYDGPPPSDSPLGLPPGLGAPIWSLPGVMPTAAPPKAAPTAVTARPVDPNVAEHVLEGSLHSKDKTTGIAVPGAGLVANALGDAVRSGAPLDARATFEVKLGGDGSVEGIKLVRASAGDGSNWDRVVSAAKGALSARKLQMGADGKGVTVVVKVESSVEYPAGSREALQVQPVCANEVIEQLEAALKSATEGGSVIRGVKDDAGRFIPYDGMTDDQRRKFCIPIGVRGKGDASNIGAHATNVVRSTFQIVHQGEKALQAEAVLPVDTRVPWAPADPTKVRPATPPPPKKKKKKWK